MAPVSPSDLILYVVKIIDKWSVERRKAGNTILLDLGDKCLIHIDV